MKNVFPKIRVFNHITFVEHSMLSLFGKLYEWLKKKNTQTHTSPIPKLITELVLISHNKRIAELIVLRCRHGHRSFTHEPQDLDVKVTQKYDWYDDKVRSNILLNAKHAKTEPLLIDPVI